MNLPSNKARGFRLPPRPRVAVVGASGLVGEKIMQVLTERAFPYASLDGYSPRDLDPTELADRDLIFLATPADVALRCSPELVAAGCVVVDLSPAWRLDPQVPLVVPEVNGELLAEHSGVIACPNCTNVPLVMVLAALQTQRLAEQVIVTTMQAASGVGRAGLECLQGGPSPFAQELTNNLLPQCDDLLEQGDSAEERRLVGESQRLLQQEALAISATCVRVPVRVGHALSVTVRFDSEVSVDQAREDLNAFAGLRLYQAPDYPSVLDCVGNDMVHVGRLRQGSNAKELQMWLACDNLRKGAATNAVQIAEALLPL